MSSLRIADNTFESVVQEFHFDIGAMARKTGAFMRSRAIRHSSDLMRAVLLYSGLDHSLREVAADFTRAGRRLSDEAVRRRLCGCEAWLTQILQEMLGGLKRTADGGLNRLILLDGTTIQAPGARTTDFRLHIGWDWIGQKVVHSLITDRRTGESLKLFDWQPGDVAIADAAYATAQQLKSVWKNGAEYIVRCAPANIRLFSTGGKRIDIVAELMQQTGKVTVTKKVWIETGDGFRSAYIHAFRQTEEARLRAHARLRVRARKSCSKTKPETLFLAGWMLLLTSIEPTRLPADSVVKLYRSRWQIELVIKRLKSVLKIHLLRAGRDSHLARVYLLGKVIYALLIEKRALRAVADRSTDWRIWKLIAERLRSDIVFPTLEQKITDSVVLVLKERPRKRKRLRELISGPLECLEANFAKINRIHA